MADGIALKILDAFCDRRRIGPVDCLVLNGLPRHLGQARDLAGRVAVRRVVVLDCSPEAVTARLRLDPGGDRAERRDDQPEDVAAKLAWYRSRTEPLIAHGFRKLPWDRTPPPMTWSRGRRFLKRFPGAVSNPCLKATFLGSTAPPP